MSIIHAIDVDDHAKIDVTERQWNNDNYVGAHPNFGRNIHSPRDFQYLVHDDSLKGFGIPKGTVLIWNEDFEFSNYGIDGLYVLSLSSGDIVVRRLNNQWFRDFMVSDGDGNEFFLFPDEVDILGKVMGEMKYSRRYVS